MAISALLSVGLIAGSWGVALYDVVALGGAPPIPRTDRKRREIQASFIAVRIFWTLFTPPDEISVVEVLDEVILAITRARSLVYGLPAILGHVLGPPDVDVTRKRSRDSLLVARLATVSVADLVLERAARAEVAGSFAEPFTCWTHAE